MKPDRMPVTPAVIRWAREHAGIRLADARESFGEIEEWESGSSRPTYCEIEQLADQYKVPVAVFFFPEPPDLPPIPESLRLLPSDDFNGLPSNLRPLIRRAQAYQLDIEELYQVQRTERRSILKDLPFRMDTPIHEMTTAVRNHLGVSIQDQFQWRNSGRALIEWRSAFFRSGVFVIKDLFPERGFDGFCLYDGLSPVIYLNSSFTYERQVVILFQALAVLLLDSRGIDFGRNGYVDGICLDFACEALVPSAEFEKHLGSMQAPEQTAITLASRFHVSPQLIFRRFRDRNLISEAAFQSAITKLNSQHRIEQAPDDLCQKAISVFGRDFVGLALNRHYAGLIDEERLADHLDVKVGEVETLVSCYEQLLD